MVRFALALPLFVVVSCGGEQSARRTGENWTAPEPAPPAAEAGGDAVPMPSATAVSASASHEADEEPGFEGTAGVTQKQKPDVPMAVLKDVRTGKHGSYDRVVFEFAGERLPGYHLEYVDKPVRACGSGKVHTVAGQGWLRVRIAPASAHEGHATPKGKRVHMPILQQLEPTCDADRRVEWVLGLSSPNPYRVLELSDPPRIVVDVLHGPKAAPDEAVPSRKKKGGASSAPGADTGAGTGPTP